jgi:hypothetical protein
MILDVTVAQRSLPYQMNRTRDHHRVVVSALLGRGCSLEERQVAGGLGWKGLLEAKLRGRDSSDSKVLLAEPWQSCCRRCDRKKKVR